MAPLTKVSMKIAIPATHSSGDSNFPQLGKDIYIYIIHFDIHSTVNSRIQVQVQKSFFGVKVNGFQCIKI